MCHMMDEIAGKGMVPNWLPWPLGSRICSLSTHLYVRVTLGEDSILLAAEIIAESENNI